MFLTIFICAIFRHELTYSNNNRVNVKTLSSLIFLVATRCCRLSPADLQRPVQSNPAATPAGAGADELSWRLQRTLRLPAGTPPSLHGRRVNPSLPQDSQTFVHNYLSRNVNYLILWLRIFSYLNPKSIVLTNTVQYFFLIQ